MSNAQAMIAMILAQYPRSQAVYLFGSYGTADERPQSDVDIAVLLPVEEAKQVDSWQWLELAQSVASAVGRDVADLINLREVDLVLRKEIIFTGRRICTVDENMADQFEMLTTSLYQQLQQERKEIIEEAITSGRFRHA